MKTSERKRKIWSIIWISWQKRTSWFGGKMVNLWFNFSQKMRNAFGFLDWLIDGGDDTRLPNLGVWMILENEGRGVLQNRPITHNFCRSSRNFFMEMTGPWSWGSSRRATLVLCSMSKMIQCMSMYLSHLSQVFFGGKSHTSTALTLWFSSWDAHNLPFQAR